jgi:hypothetical protein
LIEAAHDVRLRHSDLFQHAAHAGKQAHGFAHRSELPHLGHLGHEVVEREIPFLHARASS